MLVTFGICFKQHFDTRYLVFYNPSPPRMFLSLDLFSEYRMKHGAIGPLYVTSSYSIWIFCWGVSGFATDSPCDVCCRGLTTCFLHVGPPFRSLQITGPCLLVIWTHYWNLTIIFPLILISVIQTGRNFAHIMMFAMAYELRNPLWNGSVYLLLEWLFLLWI